ncbi:MAG: glycosyltransferase family 2 protein [Actinomycetota bacterium]|jgi:glycosyltransferase involved in cell wall biosynthesis|nr:glycosyltransferase family 2 protein [Actinomycetota bacterium]
MESSAVKYDVSIVLPIHNEAGHLVEEIERIRRAMDASRFSYEIIAVDDGSTDGSAAELATVDAIRVIRFADNRGSGSARRYGSSVAQGEVVVWTDVDMTYPNDQIPELVDALQGHDQVVGARRSEEGTVKLFRRPAKWLIRKLASYLAGVKIPDLNSGFRAFRREVGAQFLHLLPRGFSCVTTLTMTFLTNGYSIRYVPIDYAPRRGVSKFHWWSDTRRFILQVVRMALSYEPLRVFGPPAAILGITGIGKLIYDLFDKDFRVGTNTIVLLGFAGSLLLIGLLADLLVQLNRRRHDAMPAVAADTQT